MTTASESSRAGHIIAFTASHGGVGRSTALANVAWVLATAGRRVLVMDWDLDEPSLHKFFRPFLVDPDLADTDGILDAAVDVASATASPAERDATRPIGRYLVSLDWPFPAGGAVDFLPAGRQTPAYAVRAASFDWNRFLQSPTGEAFLDGLVHTMRREYDVVLLDAPRGVSAVAQLCTLYLPDAVAVCFTYAPSSVEGARRIAEGIASERVPVAIYPVPMRAENFEKQLLDDARRHAHESLRQFLAPSLVASADAYFSDVETQYVPYYAFGEVLAAFVEHPRQGTSLLASAERLASHLVGAPVRNAAYASPEERARVLAAYRQRLRALPSEAPADLWR